MKNTILVIEDNDSMRENTAELLQLAGYIVSIAKNGKEGLEVAIKNPPDLVICDIFMPELDGYGVLRAMKNIPELSEIPFVFFTAISQRDVFRKAMDLGADDFLTKPFEGDDLLRIAENKLRKRSLSKSKVEEKEQGLSEFMNDVLSLNEIASLALQRTVKQIKNKYPIYSEGDTASNIYFLKSGKIKIFKTNESGKEYILSIHQQGEFFGYAAVLDNNGLQKQSATAIENSEIILVPKQDFYSLLTSNREFSLKFIRYISSQIIETEEKLLKLAYNSARKKVADTLLFLFRPYQVGGKMEKSLHVNRENLSAIAGISPESISRNLADFRDEGLIESENAVIRILDFKKLERIKD
ncbi:MAG: response regulator [Bacteroidetes bacterium]|nr:response regulator [Bacteroidota bacterium]